MTQPTPDSTSGHDETHWLHKLEASETQIHAILETAVDAIITIDEAGVIQIANPAVERMFGYSAYELVGNNIAMLMPSPYRDQHDEYMKRYHDTHEPRIIGIGREAQGQRKDGTIFPIDLAVGEARIGGKRIYTGFVRDISDRKAAENALRESEERFRFLAENLPGVIYLSQNDEQYTMLYLNDEIESLTGVSKQRFLEGEVSYIDLIREVDRPRVRECIREAAENGKPYEVAYRVYQTGGGVRWVREIGAAISQHGELLREGYITDITEQRQLEREVADASAREQQRIGQDIHDGLGQQLTGIGFLASVLETALTKHERPEAGQAAEIGRQVRSAISHSRALVKGLCPVNLDEQGFMAAMAKLSETVTELYAIPCDFECPVPIAIKDHARATHLYYIAHEAVTNAIRHGKPTKLAIRLEYVDEHLVRLAIVDNGSGIDKSKERSSGRGTHIMPYRARVIGGTMHIRSLATGGTEVECVFPVERDDRSE